MKFFYDTEFLEDGRTIELISIGIVDETGREYYAINADMPIQRIEEHSWLMGNVVPYLPGVVYDGRFDLDYQDSRVKTKSQIAREVLEFLTAYDGRIDLWAWFAAYDHVVLAQLWGIMINMPARLPQYTKDVRQLVDEYNVRKLPSQVSGHHDALADARHVKTMYNYIREVHGE